MLMVEVVSPEINLFPLGKCSVEIKIDLPTEVALLKEGNQPIEVNGD